MPSPAPKRRRDAHSTLRAKLRLWSVLPRTAPILAALLVVVSGLVAISFAGPEAYDHAFTRAPRTYPDEAVARVFWFVTFVALSVGLVGVTAFSAVMINRHAASTRSRWLQTTVGLAAMTFLINIRFSMFDQQHGLKTAWRALACLHTRFDMTWFFHLLNSAGTIATVFVVSAVSSTCIYLESPLTASDPRRIRTAIRDLRALLYAIAITLMIATIELFAVHNWVTASAPENEKPVTRTIAIVLAGGLGAMYSIFLLTVFATAAWFHRRAASAAADARIPAELGRDFRLRWMKEQGLIADPSTDFAKLAAIAGPLLTGSAFPLILQVLSGLVA